MVGLTACPRRLDGDGTPEAVWSGCAQMDRLVRWRPGLDDHRRVVVVAPHPDDEVLGAGGTTAEFAAAGADLVRVAVTDGEASHPGRGAELRRARPLESAAAAKVLGTTAGTMLRLSLPDSRVQAQDVVAGLAPLLGPGDLVLAPWVLDGHPDHEAVGSGCASITRLTGARLMSYLVWTWHWATPDDVPWPDAVRVDLGPELTGRKRRAVDCFASQIEGPGAVLTGPVIERLTRPFEVFLAR